MKYIILILTLLLSANAKDMTIRVHIKTIEDSKQVPENKVLQKYEGIEFYVFENKDNTFSIYYENNKDLDKKSNLEFSFKGANYKYTLHQDVDFVVTNLMERCDGINRKGSIDKSKKDGIIKGFPEKRCEAISKKIDMLVEIAQDKAEIAQDKEEIAQIEKNIAQIDKNIAQSEQNIAQSEQNIAQSEQNIAQAKKRMLKKFTREEDK